MIRCVLILAISQREPAYSYGHKQDVVPFSVKIQIPLFLHGLVSHKT